MRQSTSSQEGATINLDPPIRRGSLPGSRNVSPSRQIAKEDKERRNSIGSDVLVRINSTQAKR